MKNRTHISRRNLLGVSAGAAAASVINPSLTTAGSGQGGRVVVELFTSQGCSSCPPADAFMKDLIQYREVVALTLNVDYWDYLGWRDTLGSPEYSRRQRQYAAGRGDGQVYTPQMVINGKTHAIGSRRDVVLAAIQKEAGRSQSSSVPVKISQAGDQVVVDVAAASEGQSVREATVWMVMVENKVPVTIARGENTGRDITYYNVARKFMPAGTWHGKQQRFEYPKKELMAAGISGCCVLLQVDGNGPIIGAADYGALHGA